MTVDLLVSQVSFKDMNIHTAVDVGPFLKKQQVGHEREARRIHCSSQHDTKWAYVQFQLLKLEEAVWYLGNVLLDQVSRERHHI